MKQPSFIAFNGVDEHTNLRVANELAERYPIEWGVLYSSKSALNGMRYPKHYEGILNMLTGPTAVHLCGSIARVMLRYQELLSEEERRILVVERPYSRLQFNGIKDYCVKHPSDIPWWMKHAPVVFKRDSRVQNDLLGVQEQLERQCVIQVSKFHGVQGMCELIDNSGGLGIVLNDHVTVPDNGCVNGVAGGIAPDNVFDVMKFIQCDGDAEYYLDIESGVRTNDRFDLDKVEAICKKIYPER